MRKHSSKPIRGQRIVDFRKTIRQPEEANKISRAK